MIWRRTRGAAIDEPGETRLPPVWITCLVAGIGRLNVPGPCTSRTCRRLHHTPNSMRTALFLALVAAASPLVAQAPASRPASPAPVRVAVKAAHLIDPRGQGRRIDDVVVLIDGDTVVQVGAKLAVP